MGRHRKSRRKIPRAFLAAAFGAGATLAGVLLWSPSAPHSAPVALKPVHLTAPSLQSAVAAPEPSVRTYTVKAGDTLTLVAKDQCHDAGKWSRLAQVNHLGGGNALKTGQVLVISCQAG